MLGRAAPWGGAISELLGDDARLVYTGTVLATPGASDQQPHPDGFQLFAETHGAAAPPCPAHCINVFVPLVDVTDANGPTEFWLGTQASARHAQCCRAAAEGVELPGHPRLRITAKRGDAILFDWRIVHRGCANVAASERPVFYLTFARSWWTDAAKPTAPSLLRGDDAELFEYALANAVQIG